MNLGRTSIVHFLPYFGDNWGSEFRIILIHYAFGKQKNSVLAYARTLVNLVARFFIVKYSIWKVTIKY
jgi:hypothetical protein